jgi:hypothetical protein
MMSDISLFLQRGWNNIWKEKILWAFSALNFAYPLIRLVFPIQKADGLLSSLSNLVIISVLIYLIFVRIIGVTYILYWKTVGNSINILTVFQKIRNLFWRIATSTFVFFLFFALCIALCLAMASMVFMTKPLEFSDIPWTLNLSLRVLSIFSAPYYFLLAEIIVNDSGIRKSIESAWDLFLENFVNLATIGIILSIIWYGVNLVISTTTILTQYNFDFAALSRLNFIFPQSSSINNKFYPWAVTIAETVWYTFNISVFMVAYLKYRGDKIRKEIAP